MAKKVVCKCLDGLSAKGELMWKLEGHRLVIGGNGRMRDFTDTEHAPWLSLAAQIQSVVVEEGVENIGGRAFRGFTELQCIRLSSTVARIGWGAFDGCTHLEKVCGKHPMRHWRLPTLPDVTTVGHWAFRGTQVPQEELVVHDGVVLEYTGTNPAVVLPEGIREIAPYAFAQVPLESVKFPRTLERVGHGAFYATGLKSVILPAKTQQIEAFAFAGNPELSQVFLGRASVDLDPCAFDGTSVDADKRIGRWLLSRKVTDLSFLEAGNGKWSVAELMGVLKCGGVVLLAEKAADGAVTVQSCFLDFEGCPMSYWLSPYLAEWGILGENEAKCHDIASFRQRYSDPDTWLSIHSEATDCWDKDILLSELRYWKSRVRKYGEMLYISWDRHNFRGPLELALCEKWLKEHPDAFVGTLKPLESVS